MEGGRDRRREGELKRKSPNYVNPLFLPTLNSKSDPLCLVRKKTKMKRKEKTQHCTLKLSVLY